MNALHLADILNSSLESYRQHHTVSYQQLRVCQHLQSCRTGQLGYQHGNVIAVGSRKRLDVAVETVIARVAKAWLRLNGCKNSRRIYYHVGISTLFLHSRMS